MPGTNLDDAPQAVEIAKKNEDVWAAVGFHPHDAKKCDAAAFSAIEKLAKEERAVAIGEIGLDDHYMHSPREVQIAVFEKHIDRAARAQKPIIVHNRESTDDMLRMHQAALDHCVHLVAIVENHSAELSFYCGNVRFGGAERDRTVDLLNAICAFVSRHTRTPPDSTLYRGLDSSGLVRRK